MTITKIDFKKELKELYKPSAKNIAIVEVPEMNFLMIDGIGDPGTSKRFAQAMEALYPLAYTLKFMAKLGPLESDYVVMPLEGLWHADDLSAFKEDRKDEWKWTLMIMQPDFVTREMFDEAVEKVRQKKNPALLDDVRFEPYAEGESVQIIHVGPYNEVGPTVEKLHAFIDQQGKQPALRYHEIYLSDPRRTAPEKLKTVVRQPMR